MVKKINPFRKTDSTTEIILAMRKQYMVSEISHSFSISSKMRLQFGFWGSLGGNFLIHDIYEPSFSFEFCFLSGICFLLLQPFWKYFCLAWKIISIGVCTKGTFGELLVAKRKRRRKWCFSCFIFRISIQTWRHHEISIFQLTSILNVDLT